MSCQSSRERVLRALEHTEPDCLPVDFGSTNITGVHVSVVAALRDHYGLEKKPVRVIDCGQMLGELDEDLKQVMGVDVEGLLRRTSRFGFPNCDWKPWRLFDGLEVLVPGGFNPTIDSSGDVLMHPEGDARLPPSARMPNGGHFFDAITRQVPIDEDALNPEDNLQEYGPVSDAELDFIEGEARRARETRRAVIAAFGGTALGDIGVLPGVGLARPKGIRDVAEWYISIRARPGYVHRVFEGQCEIALKNLERIAQRCGDFVDAVVICGTDFGTQNSSFCSVETFRELWLPHYRRINDWIHSHTQWKTFKHSCGAVEKFIDSFIEAGFDILNPVQCSAAGMAPEHLKAAYGGRIVFWGGGVDTQRVLPFGTAAEVRDQVLRRCEVFAKGGGYVFNPVHNIQAQTPVQNVVAMVDAVREFRGVK
jgi:Uroporphyrinogen decarboxylase (URO-D)